MANGNGNGSTTSWIDKALDFAFDVGKPLARSAIAGSTGEKSLQEERNDYNRLNGSGPVDSSAAVKNAQSLIDYAFGTAQSVATANPQPVGQSNTILLVGAAILALVLIILLFRK